MEREDDLDASIERFSTRISAFLHLDKDAAIIGSCWGAFVCACVGIMIPVILLLRDVGGLGSRSTVSDTIVILLGGSTVAAIMGGVIGVIAGAIMGGIIGVVVRDGPGPDQEPLP